VSTSGDAGFFERCLRTTFSGIVLSALALAAHAHLLSAGRASVQVFPEKVVLLISVPVSTLRGVDTDQDGMLQPVEIKQGRSEIIRQLEQGIALTVGGDAGRVLDDQLIVSSHVDNRSSTTQVEWLRHLLVDQSKPGGEMKLQFSPQMLATDYLVEVRRGDLLEIVKFSAGYPSHTFFKDAWGTLKSFWVAGVEHILFGADHLVFLVLLLLSAVSVRRWLWVLSTFTVAHGLTYTLASLEVIYVKPTLVEAVIAATIILTSILHLAKFSLPLKWEMAGTFGFGLFHGLGFASAMGDMAINKRFPVSSVAGFNLGIEFGQLIVAFVTGLIFLSLARIINDTKPIIRAISFGGLSIGCYWFFQRL
jgi:hydrogenase/urease accessory protein HupE